MRATSSTLRAIALKWATDRGINPITEFQPRQHKQSPTLKPDADTKAIHVDPVPSSLVRVSGGRTWLWLPAECLTSHANTLHRTTGHDVRLSNIWYWTRGQRHKCDHATGYNEKWRWTLREHGLKLWCNPALPIQKVDELQCASRSPLVLVLMSQSNTTMLNTQVE